MEIINLNSDKAKPRDETLSEPDSKKFFAGRVPKGFGRRPAQKTDENQTRTKQSVAGFSFITSIKLSPKNENRVNIFIDEKFAFSLDISQVVDFKLKVGKSLDKTELEKLKKASNFGKLYQRTLEWALSRPHSIRETRDYLKKKQFNKKEYGITDEDIEKIIEKLEGKNYLNDQNFAEYYIENRFKNKGISRKRLKLELSKKGINADIVEAAFATIPRDETEEIKKIIAKKRRKYDDEKLVQYLVRQGFDYQLVKSLVVETD